MSHSIKNYIRGLFLLFSLNLFSFAAVAQQKLFWSDNTDFTIKSATLDGGNIATILNINNMGNVVSLSIDDKNQKLYWVGNGSGEIRRSNLDGTNIEVVISGLSLPVSIAIDSVNSKIFWADYAGISQADIDGTGQTILRNINPPAVADSVVVDPTSGLLFWNEQDMSSANIFKLDTKNKANMFNIHVTSSVYGLVSNYATPELLWFNIEDLKLSRLNYDGSGFNNLLNLSASQIIKDVDIDFPESSLFYADQSKSTIVKLNLATLAQQNIISSPSPSGIAISCGRFALDSDKDQNPDCNETCISDPLKTAPGSCGCGVPDIDSDNDGALDCLDSCPEDANKLEPGFCGCGLSEIDSDADLVFDCNDNCPLDARKTEPGTCGCGIIDRSDSNGDVQCEEFRKLGPSTKIQIPPAVVITTDNARIIMEKFKGFTTNGGSSRALSEMFTDDFYLLMARSGGKSKAKIRYDAYIRPVNSNQNKRKRLTSKRNVLTFRNLKPNNYQVRYRVLMISEGRVIGRTNFSPKNVFEIPES